MARTLSTTTLSGPVESTSNVTFPLTSVTGITLPLIDDYGLGLFVDQEFCTITGIVG